MFDHKKQYAEARKQLAQWLAEGKIKRQETIVKGGLKVAEQALLDLFKGGNTGEQHMSFRYPFGISRSTMLMMMMMIRKTACRSQIS